ncbi:MAG: antitoxin Xre/MbcA/ParS toxin-binding domain-containing protein [Bryobacteraceae bacterium]|nr:antitoxin Xre/MbcA/ParS toxin-binding domain-containing protein [Bryobacteraceae bacterium]
MVEAAQVSEILGVRAATTGDLARQVQAGLPKSALTRVAHRVFPAKKAAGAFVVSVVPLATLKRRTRLSPRESERTERLARLTAAAEYVWDDRDLAREWLNAPHPELDGEPPIRAALTELGARRAEAILDNILYGLPA